MSRTIPLCLTGILLLAVAPVRGVAPTQKTPVETTLNAAEFTGPGDGAGPPRAARSKESRGGR